MIYFDHAASSPLRKEALDAFTSALKEDYANPSSAHALGRRLSREVDAVSEKFLRLLSLDPKVYRVLWTSCATESNNLALKGLAHHYRQRGTKILSSLGEHESVHEPLTALAKEGYDVRFLPLDPKGAVDLGELEKALDKSTILVSVLATNNETGSRNDLGAIRSLLGPYPKALFHSDLTQGLFKEDFPLETLDCFSFSAHKFGGPKGVGGLVAKKKLIFDPLLDGGGQEEGFRSGTLNYPGILATYKAAESWKKEGASIRKNVTALNSYLREELSKNPEILINSSSDGSPYILNFSLRSKRASVLLEALSEVGIYVSSLSACSSRLDSYSRTLEAMTHDEERAKNAIRLSFGPENTLEEGKAFLAALNEILERIVHR